MQLFLQIWGGFFYLGNKVLLSISEGHAQNRRLRIGGWLFYLLGLPAWIIIFILERNWITAAIEAGSVPSMVFGLLVAWRGAGAAQKTIWARLSAWFAYALIPFGIGYSLYDYGGLVSITQLLEMGIVAGFLGGTYLLAKQNRRGWLLFMLMNASTALLMFVQENFIMAAQQVISLFFVLYGYVRSGKSAESTR